MAVEVAIEQGIARVTLSRPPLNILDCVTMEELARGFAEVRSMDSARAVLLQARGRVFSAGVDVREMEPPTAARTIDIGHRMCLELLAIEAPTVALVEGVASGGGCELALLADLVYASDLATFSQPEVGLGVLATAGAALYPARFGMRAACELLLTGDPIDAFAAEAKGLITRAYPGREARERVEELLSRIGAMSAPLIRCVKRALRQAGDGGARTPREALAAAARIFVEDMVPTEDAREGVRAFVEKRKPLYKNR